MPKPRICTIPECGKPHKARGWCDNHYSNFRKRGKPVSSTGRGVLLSFVRKAVNSKTDKCIIWPYGKTSGGYGVVVYNGKQVPAHRLSLRLKTGANPPDKVAAHKPVVCHNRACINPSHIRWATQRENVMDRIMDGTMNRGVTSPNAKLTRKDVVAIKSSNLNTVQLASLYPVTQSVISEIKRGVAWRHVQ